MTTYLGNAFSLGMLDEVNGIFTRDIRVEQVSLEKAAELSKDATSCVGHADTALLFSALLGRPVEMRRVGTSLRAGDTLVVGQYNGPRLPEGAKSLPEGAKIRWMVVTIHNDLFNDGYVCGRDPSVAH